MRVEAAWEAEAWGQVWDSRLAIGLRRKGGVKLAEGRGRGREMEASWGCQRWFWPGIKYKPFNKRKNTLTFLHLVPVLLILFTVVYRYCMYTSTSSSSNLTIQYHNKKLAKRMYRTFHNRFWYDWFEDGKGGGQGFVYRYRGYKSRCVL